MKTNSNNGEKITITILSIVILIVIIAVILLILNSNNKLSNNILDYIDETNNETNNDNTSNNVSNNNENQKTNKNNIQNISNNTSSNTSNIDSENTNIPQNNSTTLQIKEIEIASYTTTLYDKEQNRIDNINLAISKLNGKVIQKGEEFSFNNTIGPMDESNGFKKATGFDTNGKKIKISGGGLCQISSTLYNTALIANFNVTERHPHSRRVYYVPKDKDATIFYGSLDLKFINTSDADVKIIASNTDTQVTIKLVKLTKE